MSSVRKGEPAYIYERLVKDMGFDPNAWIGMFDALARPLPMPIPKRYQEPLTTTVSENGKVIGTAVVDTEGGPAWNRPTSATPLVLAGLRNKKSA